MRIALTLDRDAARAETNDYIRSLVVAGFAREEIVVLSPDRPASGEVDGLSLGGGCDVDPARDEESPRANAGVEVDPGRDALDFGVLTAARRAGTPVLAICRGLQVVNVALGGTLVQDLPTQRPSPLVHDTPGKVKTRREHEVAVKPGTRLASGADGQRLEVNSRHHQAVGRLGEGLVLSAAAPDGLVEAAETGPEEPWLVAVQWHPENLSPDGDRTSRRLFTEIARAVRGRAARQGSSSEDPRRTTR